MLEIRPITTVNLPDAARIFLDGKHPGDRPRAFTREMEVDCSRSYLSALTEKLRSGSAAWAAYRSDMLVGYAEVHPLELAAAPLEGQNAYFIQALHVPEEMDRVEVEAALLDESRSLWGNSAGLAAVSLFRDCAPLGFRREAHEAAACLSEERTLWWLPGDGGGEPPKFLPVDRGLKRFGAKARVDLFTNDRSPWDYFVFDLIRGVCDRMKDSVLLFETDCSNRRELRRAGVAAGVAIDGRYQPWLRPYKLPDEHMIRRTLESAL